jgi:RNA polymerase sigma factor (sigma-70 family)
MASAQLDKVLHRLRDWRDNQALGEVSDTQLLERFTARREEAAFTALLRRHGPMVLGVSRRILHTVQDAEDVFQATFLLLARKAGSIRKQSSVGCWLHGVAHRLALRAKQQRTCRRVHEKRAADMRDTATTATNWPDVQAALDRALDALPEKYRGALILCYLEGLTHADAAQRLGCPLATLRSHVARGRKLLRERLIKHGLTLSSTGLVLLLVANTASAVTPPTLAKSTAKAALAFAAGQQAAAICSTSVAGLVEGGLRAMLLRKIKIAGVLMLATTFVAAACGLAPSLRADAKQQAADAKPQAAQEAKSRAAADDTIAFRGRVVDPDGKPVAGAKVAFIADDKGAFVPQLSSDHEGQFTLRIPRPRTVINPRHVLVVAPGFGMDWESEHQTDATFHLVPDLPIVGRVVNLEGKPVAGATVAVHDVRAGRPGAFDGLLRNWKKTAQEQEEAAQAGPLYLEPRWTGPGVPHRDRPGREVHSGWLR